MGSLAPRGATEARRLEPQVHDSRRACDLVCAWRMLSRMGAQSLVTRENALEAICHFGRSRTSQRMLLPPRNSARHAGQLARVNRLCLSGSGISQSSRNVLRIDNVHGKPSVGHCCLDRLETHWTSRSTSAVVLLRRRNPRVPNRVSTGHSVRPSHA